MNHLFRPEWLEGELAKLKSPETNDAVERDLAEWRKRRQAAERKLKTLLDTDLGEMSKPVRDAVQSKIKAIDQEIRTADEQLASLESRLVPKCSSGMRRSRISGARSTPIGRWSSGAI